MTGVSVSKEREVLFSERLRGEECLADELIARTLSGDGEKVRRTPKEDSVASLPGGLGQLNVIQKDERVDLGHQVKIPGPREERRLHDGHFHRKRTIVNSKGIEPSLTR